MKPATYPNGTKLKLIPGTMTWGHMHIKGHADLVYEVVAQVHDGTSMERITVRAEGTSEPSLIGVTPDLFERVDPRSYLTF